MKAILGLLVVIGLAQTAAAADKRKPASQASCSAKALSAAEDQYGNDPKSTSVHPRPNNYFVVTVGIGNDEDGAHYYLVNCPTAAPKCDCAVSKEITPAN